MTQSGSCWPNRDMGVAGDACADAGASPASPRWLPLWIPSNHLFVPIGQDSAAVARARNRR